MRARSAPASIRPAQGVIRSAQGRGPGGRSAGGGGGPGYRSGVAAPDRTRTRYTPGPLWTPQFRNHSLFALITVSTVDGHATPCNCFPPLFGALDNCVTGPWRVECSPLFRGPCSGAWSSLPGPYSPTPARYPLSAAGEPVRAPCRPADRHPRARQLDREAPAAHATGGAVYRGALRVGAGSAAGW